MRVCITELKSSFCIVRRFSAVRPNSMKRSKTFGTSFRQWIFFELQRITALEKAFVFGRDGNDSFVFLSVPVAATQRSRVNGVNQKNHIFSNESDQIEFSQTQLRTRLYGSSTLVRGLCDSRKSFYYRQHSPVATQVIAFHAEAFTKKPR